MCWLILQTLLTQPLLPELPPPLELQPPTRRPVVVPLEHDTLGVGLNAGNPLGFSVIAREEGPKLSAKAGLTILQRNDHYNGFERNGVINAAGKIRNLLLTAGFRLFDFTDTTPHGFTDLSLGLFWHESTVLATLSAHGFSSTMAGKKRHGGDVFAKFYWDNPWARTLFAAQARLYPEGWGVLSDVRTQHQIGFILITPSLQGCVIPGEEEPWRAGVGLNLLAVFSDLSLELDASYNKTRPVIVDSFLLAPVNAGIGPDASFYHLTEEIVLGAGYRGVEFSFFAEQGSANFWQTNQGLALLGEESYANVGAEVRVGLERGGFSNFGSLRFLFNEPTTSWTPSWEFSDSLSVQAAGFGGFVVMDAGGDRRSGEILAPPYFLLGSGVYYDDEPFRVVLRADDLLNLASQRWPGLPGPGRRVSVELLLFTTRW